MILVLMCVLLIQLESLQILKQIADIAFIGKSLSPNVGGQSPLVATCCGVLFVYGSNMTNFRDICLSLENNKCLVKVGDESRQLLPFRH